jgi:hypothetical protein
MSESNSASTATTLDLAAPRTIVLQASKSQFVLRCRRITPEDWEKYFASIVVTSEQQGKTRINVIDIDSPKISLAEAVLESVEGYKVLGGGSIADLPNWQTRIPLAHRKQLGEVLADARPEPQDDELLIHPEAEVVMLSATWSAVTTSETGDVGTFAMQKFSGLKHVLKTPTQAQHLRYTREASRARIVGGSRNGKTVYPGANALLAALYDELIIEVEGYSVNGKELADRAAIIREMDMLHKVMAAQEVFQPQVVTEVAGGDEG